MQPYRAPGANTKTGHAFWTKTSHLSSFESQLELVLGPEKLSRSLINGCEVYTVVGSSIPCRVLVSMGFVVG